MRAIKRPTLILEGVDCSGKTTLSEEIQKQWNCKYIHVKQAPEGEDTLVHFLKAIKGINFPTIIDRLHWSEQVYAKVLRQDSLLSDRDFGVIDGYLLANRGIFVLCKPSWYAVSTKILENRGGENHNLPVSGEIYQEYTKPPRTVLPVITYDYESETVDDLLRRAEKCMEGFYGMTPNTIAATEDSVRINAQMQEYMHEAKKKEADKKEWAEKIKCKCGDPHGRISNYDRPSDYV